LTAPFVQPIESIKHRPAPRMIPRQRTSTPTRRFHWPRAIRSDRPSLRLPRPTRSSKLGCERAGVVGGKRVVEGPEPRAVEAVHPVDLQDLLAVDLRDDVFLRRGDGMLATSGEGGLPSVDSDHVVADR